MATEPLNPPVSNVIPLAGREVGPVRSVLDGTVFPATVQAVTDRIVRVDVESGPRLARRAPSCLLAPEVDDVVLCTAVGDKTYVLAVLERETAARALEVEGDLTLRSRTGSVCIEAEEGDIELCARETARVSGKVVTLAGDEGRWAARELRLLGEHLSLSATRIVQESTFAERIAGALKERFNTTRRDVEEGEHVTAGSVKLSVRNLLRMHADTAITTAKKLIKLDGDQIHLG